MRAENQTSLQTTHSDIKADVSNRHILPTLLLLKTECLLLSWVHVAMLWYK